MQTQKTKQQHTSYLWDGNRQLQQNTATHTHTIIYEQDSFEPVAQFIWLRDGLTAANDEPETNDEGWYGNNKPVIKTGVQLYHYHNDHLGTPNELTDQQGEVVWYADYEAWGNTATVEWKAQRIDNIVVSEAHLQPIRFQGQHFDEETGLHYNRFRYFDPDMGMFTTRDPIGLLGGNNVFQYAPDPTGWIDPFGLKTVDPNDINFSQRTISGNNYAETMSKGEWDWNRSPLNVMEVDGQLVSYDNRRLDAALEANLKEVKVNVVDPNAIHPDSTTNKTWADKFKERFNDKRNRKAGGVVPPTGLKDRPRKPGC